MIDFLSNNLFNAWTRFERLVLGFYNDAYIMTEPGFFMSLDDVRDELDDRRTQSTLKPVLRRYVWATLVGQ